MRRELQSNIPGAGQDAGRNDHATVTDALAAEAIRLARVAASVHRFEVARAVRERGPAEEPAEVVEASK